MKTRDRLLAVDASAADWQKNVPELSPRDVMLMRLIRVASQGINAYSELLLKPTGLTESAYHSLMAILASGDQGITPSELCDQVGQNRASINRTLTLLETEQRIQITADPGDARRRRVVITSEGRALVRTYAATFQPVVTTAFGGLDSNEKRTLEQMLRKLIETMDRAESMATHRD